MLTRPGCWQSAAVLGYSFTVTLIIRASRLSGGVGQPLLITVHRLGSFIVVVMDRIPGFSLRAPAEAEALGMDWSQLGEWAYECVQPLALRSGQF